MTQAVSGRLVRGGIWIGAGRIGVNLLTLVSTVVLARLLTPEDFGLVALGAAVTVLVKALTEMPVGSALIQSDAVDRMDLHAAWTLGVLRGLVLFAVSAAAAWPAAAIYDEPRLVHVVLVSALPAVIGGLANPKVALMQRDLVFYQLAVFQVTTKLIMFLVSAGIAIAYQSYWALLLGPVAAAVVRVALGYGMRRYRPRWSLARARKLLSFSIWLSLSSITRQLNWRLDDFLIGGVLGQATLGAYTMGSNLAEMPIREGVSPIASTLFPGLSQVRREGGNLAGAFLKGQAFLSMLAVPAALGFALIADLLVPLALGDKWSSAVIVVQIGGPVFALHATTLGINQLLTSLGRPQALFRRDLWVMAVRMPLVILGVFTYGLVGVLAARLVAGPFAWLYNLMMAKRALKLRWIDVVIAMRRTALSAAVMVAGVLGARQTLLADWAEGWGLMAVLIALGAVLYIGTHALAWLFEGRPITSPESFLLTLADKATRRLRSRWAI